MAAEVGQFVLNVPGENGAISKVPGKYIVVWKREGHTWRLHHDICNTNEPSRIYCVLYNRDGSGALQLAANDNRVRLHQHPSPKPAESQAAYVS